MRDLGTIVPGGRRAEPNVGAGPLAPAPSQAPAPGHAEPAPSFPRGTIFAADHPEAADALGFDPPLALLAELATHARTETPLAIGLLGRSGSGKSLALIRLLRSIESLSAAARGLDVSPFLGKVLSLRIDAAEIDGSAATALAGALHARLAADYPGMAIEATHAARDPRVAAREAFERLDAARHKLETERSALAEADTRRARLTESLLYETAGSQVDAYAAANRARIKNSLTGFGVPGDPILGYKDMVRGVAESGGRVGFALRAFWALKGQTKLIVIALLLALAGVGLGEAVANQTVWLGWLRNNETSAAAAAWLQAHMDWLSTLRQAAFFGAALALGANAWRALRLIQMVFRGESLLQADLSSRRRETEANFGHQTRRVETLAAEVDHLGRLAAEAEQRAGGLKAANPALAEPSLFPTDVVKDQAHRFIAAVGALIHPPARAGAAVKGNAPETPQRVIIALDNLDSLPLARARDILAQVRALTRPGYVALIAVDPARLANGAGEDEASLDKWIQAPFQIGEIAARADYAALVREILGPADAPRPPAPLHDARQSALDEPISEAETQLLSALAPLAGSSARAVKRFVNLYRLIRTQGQNHKGALALMLALDAGGTPSEIAAVNDALGGARGEMTIDFEQGGARLAEALTAAQSAQGKISVDAARRAAATARLFSFNA
jgi:hypothetical protein